VSAGPETTEVTVTCILGVLVEHLQ
jgi:hypothetical protein